MAFRTVLAGCGNMAKGWVRAINAAPELKNRIEFVGVVDVSLEAATAFKADFALDGATAGTNLGSILETTQPDLVFDIAVPTARRDIVLTALRHRCHVLTEKPMATSLEDAREMIAAAQSAERTYAVIQNRRFNDGVRRIRQTFASGTLGELTAIHTDFFIGAHFGGFREQMEHVLLLDMAIHTLDAARFVIGVDPIAVYCQESNPRGSWYSHGAAANAIFEFKNDIIFTYRGSWVAEGATTSWESAWRVVGTEGTLLWDGDQSFTLRTVAGTSGFLRPLQEGTVAPVRHPSETHGHASVIAEFLDAIEAGREPETSGTDNIKSLAMVFAAIESAKTRQRVPIAA